MRSVAKHFVGTLCARLAQHLPSSNPRHTPACYSTCMMLNSEHLTYIFMSSMAVLIDPSYSNTSVIIIIRWEILI